MSGPTDGVTFGMSQLKVGAVVEQEPERAQPCSPGWKIGIRPGVEQRLHDWNAVAGDSTL